MANTTGKKFGGREQGTPNKLTKELRVVLKNILAKELENIPEQLDKLEPRDRLEILVKIMPFAIPKLENVESSIEINNNDIDLSKLSTDELLQRVSLIEMFQQKP